MVQVDKANDCNELSRANASFALVSMGDFASGTCEGLPAVGERAHLNGLGVAESRVSCHSVLPLSRARA